MSASHVSAVLGQLPDRVFYPLNTFKCVGPVFFRTQAARDAACLLDVDQEIERWSCRSALLRIRGQDYHPDFSVLMIDGRVTHIDVSDRNDLAAPFDAAAACPPGELYRVIAYEEFENGYRLQNARDLLRYASHRTPLGDRILLLRVLDEQGSLPISECLTVFRETRPMAGLASLILNGFVEVDLDESLLGPETLVRRIRN